MDMSSVTEKLIDSSLASIHTKNHSGITMCILLQAYMRVTKNIIVGDHDLIILRMQFQELPKVYCRMNNFTDKFLG